MIFDDVLFKDETKIKELSNQTHRDTLENMELDLPSIVQQKGNFEEIMKKI